MTRSTTLEALFAATLLACGGSQPRVAEELVRQDDAAATLSLPAPPPAESAAPVSVQSPPQPSAVAHLPAGCDAALAVDLARVSAHPGIAREVVARIEELLATQSKDEQMQRVQRFVKDAGLEFPKLRVLSVCVQTETGAEPVVTFWLDAGLKPGALIPALVKARSPTRPLARITDSAGAQFASDDDMTFAQYPDGVVGFAKSPEALQVAVGAETTAYEFDPSKGFSFFVGSDLVESGFLSRMDKAADLFEGVRHLTGTADLSTGKVQLVVHTSSQDSAKKVDALATLLKDAALKDPKLPKQFGVRAAMASLTSRVDGSRVIVEVTFAAAGIDEAVKFLGGAIESGVAKFK